LHRWILAIDGLDLDMYLNARFIAFFCSAMHRVSHWQLRPMLSNMGSRNGTAPVAAAAVATARTAAALKPAARSLNFLNQIL
jgi:hypothetical protein